MENIQAIIKQNTKLANRAVKRKASEMSQSAAQIRSIHAKLSHATQQHAAMAKQQKQFRLIASLSREGVSAWVELNETNKWKKENLLAVLCCPKKNSDSLPAVLSERLWSTRSPPATQRDPDIVLARLTSSLTENDFKSWYLRTQHPYPGNVSPAPTFKLPPSAVQQKCIVIAALKRYPELLKQDVIPCAFLDDSQVFLTYCQSERHKTPGLVGAGCTERDALSNLVAKFSARIRGDPVLMVEAVTRLQPNAVFTQFDEKLSKDGNFAEILLAAYERHKERPPENFLERFARFLRADTSLVRRLLAMNGRCLKHGSWVVKSDVEMVKIACHNNSSAIVFALGLATKPEYDKDFLLNVLTTWPYHQPGVPELYKMLPPLLRNDHDIIVACHARGNIQFSDVPSKLTTDPSFWKAIITRDSSIWYELPETFISRIDFARVIEQFSSAELVEDVLDCFPVLAEQLETWYKVTRSSYRRMPYGGVLDLCNTFQKFAPDNFFGDKKLMLEACAEDYEMLRLLPAGLAEDRDILEAAIDNSGYALSYIPGSVQVEHPDLVIRGLKNCDDEVYPDMVAASLWDRLEVAEAWFSAGGYVHEHFSGAQINEEEFGRLVTEEASRRMHLLSQCGDSFWHSDCLDLFLEGTSEELRSNKSFMKRAVELHPWLYLQTGESLRQDIDLAITAFGGPEGGDLLDMRLSQEEEVDGHGNSYWRLLEFLHNVRDVAKKKVETYDGFTQGFQRGFSPQSGAECKLSILVKGEETTTAFQKQIAEYLGMPEGSHVRKLRNVVQNLKHLPPVFDDECDFIDWRLMAAMGDF